MITWVICDRFWLADPGPLTMSTSLSPVLLTKAAALSVAWANALGASSEATKGRLRGIRDKFREAGETASFRIPALAEIALMHEESLRASAAANDDD